MTLNTAPSVAGYLDRMSYAPGETISVHASGDSPTVSMSLVRLGRGPVPGRDLPAAVETLDWRGAGRYLLHQQSSCVGGFFVAELDSPARAEVGFTVGAHVYPTLPGPAQTLVHLPGEQGTDLRLVAENLDVTLTIRTGNHRTIAVQCANVLRARAWSFVAARVTVHGVELHVVGLDPLYAPSAHAVSGAGEPITGFAGSTVTFAAAQARDVTPLSSYTRGRATDFFEGKLAAPFVVHGTSFDAAAARSPDVLAAAMSRHGGALWDLAPQPPGPDRLRQPVIAGAAAPGLLVNLPTQGVTGPNWDGTSLSFRERPEQYSAAHFHSTDLVDCGWDPLVTVPLPTDLPSGIYGVELRAEDGTTDTVPLFVRPAPGQVRKRIAFLAPTFTYLAYGNEDLLGFFSEIPVHILHGERELREFARTRQVYRDRAFGPSLYDRHPDGSGVHTTSCRRPMLDQRADTPFWAFFTGARGLGADMYLVEWLDQFGYEFDVITDLDLHTGGIDALAGHDVVLTGSHPEYHSGRILDALEQFRDTGGKIGYLGGNGFYWVTGVLDEQAPVIEIRRGHVGIRTWASEPGETDVVSSWEPGGLWRFRGRAPQRLVGVGMAAQGPDSRPYRIHDNARAAAPWFFQGIDGDVVGDTGFINGNAAGDEIDRVDTKLGTPPNTIVLASAGDHPEGTQRAAEELLQLFHGSASGPNDPDIRADMVWFETPGGGAVFSTGSISYLSSILADEGENSSSRVLRNVLDRFLVQAVFQE